MQRHKRLSKIDTIDPIRICTTTAWERIGMLQDPGSLLLELLLHLISLGNDRDDEIADR